MKRQSLVFILIVLLALSTTNQAITSSDWGPVDINDPHVVDIAKFAVTAYNKRNTVGKLAFEKVISGESQNVINGTNFRLTLSARQIITVQKYRAIVLEKPLVHFRNLVSFELINA